MSDKQLYEYAVIRVVPKVEREEFLNVGIILFCKRAKQIKVRFAINEARLLALSPDIDMDQIRLNLDSFVKIANGLKIGGPIAQFDVPERFRWLTAVRSSVIQTSRPHPGMCSDLDGTFERLFAELVL
ncbi:DUF3037 domain-containing protein [Flavobacterium sp.]|uniref:DUF3037 domain-containing protein n=1 Tax=Flavobacterium sp. TaxID=239 RepID=UPI0039E6E661